MGKPITELPDAKVELDIPEVGEKPTTEIVYNLKKAAEAIGAHEDKTILQELKIPRLTMDGFHDDIKPDDDLSVKVTKKLEKDVIEAMKTSGLAKEYQNNPHPEEEE